MNLLQIAYKKKNVFLKENLRTPYFRLELPPTNADGHGWTTRKHFFKNIKITRFRTKTNAALPVCHHFFSL